MRQILKVSCTFWPKGTWYLLIVILLCPLPAFALENQFAGNYVQPQKQDSYYTEKYEVSVSEKFKRGVENGLLGWMEVPQGIKSEIAYRRAGYLNPGIETIFLGAFRGAWNGAKRTAVGFYEVFTCIYPQEPIMSEIHEWLY